MGRGVGLTLFASRQSLQRRLVPDRSARLFHKPHGGNETYMPPIKETERVSEVCVQGLWSRCLGGIAFTEISISPP